ncbi:hypothetical protein GCM10027568_32780 [Humibacter soli]
MTRRFGYCIFTFEGGDWSVDDFDGLERGFRLARELGYSYVEGTSYVKPGLLNDDPRTDLQFLNRIGTISDLSAKYDLPLSSIFAAADLWDESERIVEFHHFEVMARIVSTLGITSIPVTVGMHRGSDDQRWSRKLGTLFTEAGLRTSALGVKLLVHPHIETPLESRDDIDAFFETADTSVIGMCMDTGHILAGGSDPVAFARDTHPSSSTCTRRMSTRQQPMPPSLRTTGRHGISRSEMQVKATSISSGSSRSCAAPGSAAPSSPRTTCRPTPRRPCAARTPFSPAFYNWHRRIEGWHRRIQGPAGGTAPGCRATRPSVRGQPPATFALGAVKSLLRWIARRSVRDVGIETAHRPSPHPNGNRTSLKGES